MSIFQDIWTDFLALLRLLEHDAVALIATAPVEVLRAIYLAAAFRPRVAR